MQVLGQTSVVISSGPLAPAWIVIPLAIVTLLVVAGHVLALEKAEMPASLKRIRRVNGLLMMFTVPLAAYAFGIANPARMRLFVMVWTIVFGLVFLVLALAVLDMLNTWRVTWREKRELKQQVDAAKAAARVLQAGGARIVHNGETAQQSGRDS